MNETIETIHSLRSYHGFSEKEIASSDLKTILDTAVCAATASGRQSYSIIVIEDKELLKGLFYAANKALVFCVDYTRLVDIAKHLNHSYEPKDVVSFITGSTDTILAAQTAAITAKSLGIESLFTNSVHRVKLEELYERLNLPEQYCFPLIGLCLGYPSKEPDRKKSRLRGKGVIHYGKYQKLSPEELDHIVKEYDDKEKHLGIRSVEQWSEMGFEHYFDWFFTKWVGRGGPNTRNEEFRTMLKKVSFLQ